MPCTACQRRRQARLAAQQAATPFDAKDILVVAAEARQLAQDDWSAQYKLLILIPQAKTPVCESELGAMNKWYAEFQELGCELIAVGTDSPKDFMDWYDSEPLLANPKFKTFCTTDVPRNLGLLQDGRPKRASVFVVDGEVVKQEHFHDVGRSFAELHRQLAGYVSGDYCQEGWQPSV